MIDLDAPDPFALAAWRANRMPNDPAKLVWLMCSFLHVVYGWPVLEIGEHYLTITVMSE